MQKTKDFEKISRILKEKYYVDYNKQSLYLPFYKENYVNILEFFCKVAENLKNKKSRLTFNEIFRRVFNKYCKKLKISF